MANLTSIGDATTSQQVAVKDVSMSLGDAEFWVIDDLLEAAFKDPRDVTEVALIRLHRKASELIEVTLKRVCSTLAKKSKYVQHNNHPIQQWEAVLLDGEGAVVASHPQQQSTLKHHSSNEWKDGYQLQFHLLGNAKRFHFNVVRDAPRIHEIFIPMLPVVGFPMVCDIKSDFCETFKYRWEHGDGLVTESVDWYVPVGQDAGFPMSLSVTPINGSKQGNPVQCKCEYDAIMVDPVASAPRAARIALMGDVTANPDAFRVMSYNLLWGLSDEKAAAKSAEFKVPNNSGDDNGNDGGDGDKIKHDTHKLITKCSQLPVDIRSREYRQHVLLEEITAYSADIVCLQEVISQVFDPFLQPYLAREGYGTPKMDHSGELVTLWKRSRFDEIASEIWRIGDLVDSAVNADIQAALRKNPRIDKHFRKQIHIAQVVKLKDKLSGREVIVVNVHLIQGESSREHVRALQTCLVLRQVQHWAAYRECEVKPVLMFLGDFNVRGSETSIEGILSLLEKGKLPHDHHCFVNGRHIAKQWPELPLEERCATVVNYKHDVCPQPRFEGASHCWDHSCQCCGENLGFRWKERRCHPCFLAKTEPPPFPDHVTIDTADCELRLSLTDKPLSFTSVYKEKTGSRSLYECYFAPNVGLKRDYLWYECKDHIYYETSKLKALVVAGPPPMDTIVGLPNLTWGSDHMAYVADFEFAQ
eukprot:m.143887 g.143887  ORF g.143887 m.143887 type:complete len:699 (-) comp30342_c1_seq1:189-2285(-)